MAVPLLKQLIEYTKHFIVAILPGGLHMNNQHDVSLEHSLLGLILAVVHHNHQIQLQWAVIFDILEMCLIIIFHPSFCLLDEGHTISTICLLY